MENLQKQWVGMILMEIIWWVFTAITAIFLVQPLWVDFVIQDFIYEAMMYIVVFITYTRYMFGLKYTFLAKFQAMKAILVFASLPVVVYLISTFFNFQDFLDKQNEGMIEFQTYFREGISFEDHDKAMKYLEQIYTYFAICAIVVVLYSPFRLLLSFWRVHNNTGTV